MHNGICGASGWGTYVTVKTSEDTLTVIAELHGPIVTDRDSEWDLGSERGTNNTGEVCAQIQALFYLANTTVDTPAAILFDSQYAAQATQGISNAKTNVELIAKAREALELARAKCSIDFIHVKGHSADERGEGQQPRRRRSARQDC